MGLSVAQKREPTETALQLLEMARKSVKSKSLQASYLCFLCPQMLLQVHFGSCRCHQIYSITKIQPSKF